MILKLYTILIAKALLNNLTTIDAVFSYSLIKISNDFRFRAREPNEVCCNVTIFSTVF